MADLSQPHSGKEFTAPAIGIIAYCFVMNMIARGISETFAVFLLPVASDTGWSRSELTGIYAIFMVSLGLTAPFLGTLFDRAGGRVAYALGLIIYASGYLLASMSSAVWQLYIGLGLCVGIGVGAIGMAPSTAIISRWFKRRMSFAMGCANAGLGVGLLLLAPFTHLIIEAYGWRTAYQILAGLIIAPLPFVLFAPWRKIMQGPVRRGMVAPMPGKPSLFLPAAIIKSHAFWGLAATFFFTSCAIYLVNVQLVAYLTDSGFDPIVAASAYGATSTVAIIGILSTGWLADIHGRRRVLTISYSLTLTGIALVWATGFVPVTALMMLALLVYGLGMGARGPVISTLVARLYPHNVAGVFGSISVGMGLGAGLGAWLSGALYDATGGYTAGFMVSLVSALLGLAQFWWVPALASGEHPQPRHTSQA